MLDFFRDMSVNPLLLTGLLAGVLASVACGVVGPYVVSRRIVFLAGAVAHTAVGGIGAAIFLAHRFPETFDWLRPIHGAMAAALLGALAMGLVAERERDRLDTLIGAMWAVGMSVGILLIRFTPGYHVELMSYLFGNIAAVGWSDVRWMLALDAIVLLALVSLHKRFLAICLDEEFASIQNVPPRATGLLLLLLVALTVVSLMQVVGLILVIALLTLPAATASRFVTRMLPLIATATVLCLFFTLVPRVLAYGTAWSPEAAIVLAAGVVYLASLALPRRT